MARGILNFVVDVATALALFGLVATGLIIRFALPPGSGSGRWLWGLGRHDWGNVHFWTAAAMVALLSIHVALHWTWVCTMTRRLALPRSREPAAESGRIARYVWGIGFLAALVAVFGGFTWLAERSVAPARPAIPPERATAAASEGSSATGDDERGPRAEGRPLPGDEPESRGTGPAAALRGSMTLDQAAALTGVPVDTLKDGLGLPPSVSGGERIGPLMQRYGFRMSEVRRVVEKHAAAAGASGTWISG
jgi:hypothetical protein